MATTLGAATNQGCQLVFYRSILLNSTFHSVLFREKDQCGPNQIWSFLSAPSEYAPSNHFAKFSSRHLAAPNFFPDVTFLYNFQMFITHRSTFSRNFWQVLAYTPCFTCHTIWSILRNAIDWHCLEDRTEHSRKCVIFHVLEFGRFFEILLTMALSRRPHRAFLKLCGFFSYFAIWSIFQNAIDYGTVSKTAPGNPVTSGILCRVPGGRVTEVVSVTESVRQSQRGTIRVTLHIDNGAGGGNFHLIGKTSCRAAAMATAALPHRIIAEKPVEHFSNERF